VQNLNGLLQSRLKTCRTPLFAEFVCFIVLFRKSSTYLFDLVQGIVSQSFPAGRSCTPRVLLVGTMIACTVEIRAPRGVQLVTELAAQKDK
jgi:hypothetical protein